MLSGWGKSVGRSARSHCSPMSAWPAHPAAVAAHPSADPRDPRFDALRRRRLRRSCDDGGHGAGRAGIALLPVSELGGDFEAGRLVHLLPDWRGLAREIYVVWPTGRLLSARAMAMRTEMERFIRLTLELQGEIPGLHWPATKCSNSVNCMLVFQSGRTSCTFMS